MDDFKGKISKEVLDTLTMEDLWKSPRLKKYVEEKYPRAYLAITEPMREFGFYHFIKLAESQKNLMREALDIGSIENYYQIFFRGFTTCNMLRCVIIL